ncbi:efflux RND transporter periplasmic adaptor subunit [Celeribacter halophilus]|uniref:efflux RND transporter periplasmic adaptor subunit n=1 Tax=Celeribacter halophilus TaxID=576117 RepID=UPI001C0A2D22|nr:efflux RND transporter periplasmic adaptor subunit [Celeribacter halophilus]MBU2889398.1 efflux RND transporter periplasmic adaptor subunit [Celeribacter halophilus]MDO6509364.1 efflux RND transporter periplasmic adaptor subunit [Celeribacter halophilus]
MRRTHLLTILLPGMLLIGTPMFSETLTLTPQAITEWKPVYAEVEPRDRVPARARIGGTITTLDVTEGDVVEAGQRVALIEDTKLLFQIEGIDAQLDALNSQLEKAQDDLTRGESLSERGVISTSSLQALQTNVTVLEGQITSLKAERQVVSRQIEEGEVLAPEAGVVLDVPVSKGGVIMAGEEVATIGSGGTFLRLGVSERYADTLTEGDTIQISGAGEAREGRLAKIYPLIESGRVEADVEVEGLDARFVGRRVQVRLPVGSHDAFLVPQTALTQSGGLDFVQIEQEAGTSERVVVPGNEVMRDGVAYVEILSGLAAGDKVVTRHE